MEAKIFHSAITEIAGIRLSGWSCSAKSIKRGARVEEGKEIMQEYKGAPALDVGLLAAAQAVEHYEISRYGALKTWAEKLGVEEAVNLLDATLNEEEATDETLTEIAQTAVNVEAEAGKEQGED